MVELSSRKSVQEKRLADTQDIFAHLAEREKTKGHHSPEGRAIRTLSRALSGWSVKLLSGADALILCDQCMEDWLRLVFNLPSWSGPPYLELIAKAQEEALIAEAEAQRLRRLHARRAALRSEEGGVRAAEVVATLKFCIQLVQRYW